MTEHNPDGTPDERSPWAPAAEAAQREARQGEARQGEQQGPASPSAQQPPDSTQAPGDRVLFGSPYASGPVPPASDASGPTQLGGVGGSIHHMGEAGGSTQYPGEAGGSPRQLGDASGATQRMSGPPRYQPHQPPPMPAYLQVPDQRASRQPAKRGGGLVVGMAVLALLVGGGAGAAGGYLVADSRPGSGPVVNALDGPPPASQTGAAPAGTVEAAAQKVLPSVVQLQVQGRNSAGEGSGFVISSDGLIVTNNHVIAGAVQNGQIVAVFNDGRSARATIVGRDPDSDVAVVKAQDVSGLPVAELGRSDDLRVGQGVVAVGSPFELAGTVTTGIVSALHRPTRAGGESGEQRTVMDAIQTDAAINPGNSGGPLADLQGRVVGINSAIYSPSRGEGAGSVGIGFAIPIDQARRTADEIAKTGKATQTVLGVSVNDNPPSGSGARIVGVTADGPAAKAGLQEGDVVTRLNDRKIQTSDALVAAVRAQQPGVAVKLVLGDNARTIEVTLAGQPVPVN